MKRSEMIFAIEDILNERKDDKSIIKTANKIVDYIELHMIPNKIQFSADNSTGSAKDCLRMLEMDIIVGWEDNQSEEQ